MEKFSYPIISLTINMPGPNKLNEDAKYIFDVAMAEILKLDLKIIQIQINKAVSGFEAQFAINEDVIQIKQAAISIEENHPLGRYMDIDVLDINKKIISRKDISTIGRKCFLCENDAKICARSKRHSIVELLSHIHNEVLKYEENRISGL